MRPYRDFLPDRRFSWSLALAPDGDQVAYIDDSSGQLNLTVQPTGGGAPRRLTGFTDRVVSDVIWHPGGRSLVIEADREGDELRQLLLVDAAGGELQELTDHPEAQYNLGEFSPDGTRLAYVGNDLVPGDQDILVRDMTSGTVTRPFAGLGQLWTGEWSPDGTRLSAVLTRAGFSDHVMYLVPVAGGEPRPLTPLDGQAFYWPGRWLPDGSGFLVQSNAGREHIGLAVLDAATGDLTWLETPEWDVTGAALSADGKTLMWLVNVDGAAELRARDLTTGAPVAAPALPTGEASSLDLSADGRLAVMRLSTPTSPANVTMVDLADGTLRTLTAAVPAATDPDNLVEPELVHYPAQDGERVPAYLYRPRGAGDTTGVVLAVHGGPTMQERPTYHPLYQYLLHHGVAVLAPNVSGSTGYGKSYMMRVYRDWGGRDLANLADAAGWLHRQPWVDPARVGLYGRSYGGFAVLSCVSRLPELGWAAAVVECGISNLVTLARSSPPTWRSRVAAIIGDPDTDEDFLRSRSPVTYADQIRAPLMIIQGANDRRVPQAESDQIVRRLRERGVEVRYDVYPDEGHHFGKRENVVKASSDAGEFLLDHLTKRG